MCGLAGIVYINLLNNKDYLERKLNKSYHYLKARGPDEKGKWHDENAFFLHTRLKIIDLQNSSAQPMEYGNYVLSYNGEIYNFKDLKNILIQESNNVVINVANASWTPFFNGKDLLKENDKKRLNFVGQEYNKADYIYTNYIYEVDIRYNNKYKMFIMTTHHCNRMLIKSIF